MKVSFSENIGSTPAIVLRDTGDIILNPRIFPQLPEAYRRFVLGHEIGHYKYQSNNELVADHYAFHQIAGTFPESLKNTVRTLAGVLPFTTETQDLRLRNMLRLALCYDQAKNPSGSRYYQIKALENEMLNNYRLNPQMQEYMYSLPKGKVTDYEFPGYDQALFERSIGQWFHDIPISGTGTQMQNTPWPTNNVLPQTQQAIATNPAISNTATTENNSVSIDAIPDYSAPVEIDWKSVAIGILIVLAIIGISKV